MSEFRTSGNGRPFCSDFCVVWLLDVRFPAFHCNLKRWKTGNCSLCNIICRNSECISYPLVKHKYFSNLTSWLADTKYQLSQLSRVHFFIKIECMYIKARLNKKHQKIKIVVNCELFLTGNKDENRTIKMWKCHMFKFNFVEFLFVLR